MNRCHGDILRVQKTGNEFGLKMAFLDTLGYVRRPSGEVMKDPDEQAQATIELVFAQFARLGTINGVLR